jgi:hypothetical protein
MSTEHFRMPHTEEPPIAPAPGPGGRAVAISEVETLAGVPAVQWDRLAAGAHLYQSHSWLRWAEAYHGLPTRYVLARDASGALLGAVVTYLMCAVPGRLTRWYDPVRVFLTPHCDTAKAAQRWFPVLLVGGCSGYHSEVLHAPTLDAPGRAAVTLALLDRCRAIADELDCRSLAFMYAPEPVCDEVSAALRIPSRKIVTSAKAVIPLGPGIDDFDRYLARFPSVRRSKLRKEVHAFAAAGGKVTTHRLGDAIPRIARLMGAHQRKYGDLVTDAQMAHYLQTQEQHLGAVGTVFVDERDGDIRGFTLYYAHGDALYSRAGGFDPEHSPPYAYFNVAIYAPIRHALEHGLAILDLGLGSYRAKRLRGAEVTALWSVVVPPSNLEPAWAWALGRPSQQAIDAGVA